MELELGSQSAVPTDQTADTAADLQNTLLLLIKNTRRTIMEMRHGMPVWAPNDLELAAIAKSVAKERAKAATDVLQSAKHLFVNEYDAKGSTKADC